MSIVLPSDYGNLNESVAGIAGTVARMINPHHDLQMEVRNRLATDPDFAQKMADLEDASPGTMETLGLGKVGQAISNIKPSQSQMIKDNTRQAIQAASTNPQNQATVGQEAVTGMTPGQAAADTTKQQVEGSAQQQMAESPYIAQEAGVRALVPGRGLLDIAQGQAALEAHQRASGRFADAEHANLPALARNYVNGKDYDTDLVNAASINPVTSQAWHEAFQSAQSDKNQENWLQRLGMRQDQIQDREGRNEAFRTSMAMGRPGDVSSIYDAMFTKDGQQGLSRVLNGEPLQPGDEKYQPLAQGFKSLQAGAMNKEHIAVGNQIKQNWSEVNNAKNDAERQDAISRLNENLQTEAGVSHATPLEVRWDEGHLGFGRGVHVYDQTGKQLDENSIMQRATGMILGHAQANALSPAGQKAWQRIQGLSPAMRVAAIHQAFVQAKGAIPQDDMQNMLDMVK